MGIGSRIKQARERLGLTQVELGKIVGVTGSSITNYENNTSHPKEPILYKLLDALHVDANYLFQDELPDIRSNVLSADEQKHIDKYRVLDSRGKNVVDGVLDLEYKHIEKRRLSNAEKVQEKENNIIKFPRREAPLYDIRVSAGTGQFLDSSSYTMIIMEEYEPPETSFLVTVTGDSMEPTYYAGDTLYIKQQPEIEVGETGLFMINGNVFVKELTKTGLKSHNPVYPEISFKETDAIHCYGKVLGVRETKIEINTEK